MNEALKLAKQRAYKRGYNVAKRKAYEWLKTIDPDYYVGTKVNGEPKPSKHTATPSSNK